MKNDSIIKKTVLLFCLVGIVYACVKENDLLDQDDGQLSVSEAQQWYNANKKDVLMLRAGNDELKLLLNPYWENSYSEKNEDYETVEVAIVSEKRFNFFDSERSEKFELSQDLRYKLSITRFVVRKNLKTKEMDGFLMTIVPDLEYMESANFDPFRDNHYLNRDKKFSGNIFYHDIEGTFVNGWLYKDGVAYSMTAAEKSSSDFELRSTCSTYYLIWEWTSCSGSYTSGSVTGNIQNGGVIPEIVIVPCISSYTLQYLFSTCGEYGSGNIEQQSQIDDSDGLGGGGGTPAYYGVGIFNNGINTNLMDQYNIYIVPTPSDASVSSVKFEIGNGSEWWTLQQGTELTCNQYAKKPGHFKIRASVVYSNLNNSTTYTSGSVDVTVLYPTVNSVINAVQGSLESTWEATKSAASSAGRSEKGFWIYANTYTLSYECGTTISGNTITGCAGTHASINLGATSEIYQTSPVSGGKYAVAFFHTHTPLTYCPSDVSRDIVGPSSGDLVYSPTVPGILYDYSATIYGGHNINAPAHLYLFGPSRRETAY